MAASTSAIEGRPNSRTTQPHRRSLGLSTAHEPHSIKYGWHIATNCELFSRGQPSLVPGFHSWIQSYAVLHSLCPLNGHMVLRCGSGLGILHSDANLRPFAQRVEGTGPCTKCPRIRLRKYPQHLDIMRWGFLVWRKVIHQGFPERNRRGGMVELTHDKRLQRCFAVTNLARELLHRERGEPFLLTGGVVAQVAPRLTPFHQRGVRGRGTDGSNGKVRGTPGFQSLLIAA